MDLPGQKDKGVKDGAHEDGMNNIFVTRTFVGDLYHMTTKK